MELRNAQFGGRGAALRPATDQRGSLTGGKITMTNDSEQQPTAGKPRRSGAAASQKASRTGSRNVSTTGLKALISAASVTATVGGWVMLSQNGAADQTQAVESDP